MDAVQLAQVESLCDALYNTVDENSRQQAQNQLLSLQSSPEYIPQCQYILNNSKSAYALNLAANSLTHLVTTHWNSFTPAQRVELRNYINQYLWNNGPGLADYVITALITLLCRITKLGWFDETPPPGPDGPVYEHRKVVEEVTQFLSSSLDRCIIGLRITCQMVSELNVPTSGRTLPQHRKTAVSFRDVALFRIFHFSLSTLQQLNLRGFQNITPPQEASLCEYALQLLVHCLNYDFIGTNPDESSEDIGTIQVPSTWRDVVTDPATMTLLFDLYRTTEPPRSSLAMQAVILLSSVRRSLFAKETDRQAYLQQLMTFICEILQSQHGLQHQENYHEFCRQLGRLKANYQLSELVRVEGYNDWLRLAAEFTVRSCEEWRWSTNSIHYLLALWGRLVAAVPYVRADAGAKNHSQRLQECILQVVQAYVRSMVDSVDVVALGDGAVDDPLDDEGSLKEQLDRLPIICRFQYDLVAQYVLSVFDPLLERYQQALQVLGPNSPQNLLQQAVLLEGKLTWLVYIVGAVVGGFSWGDVQTADGEETVDAEVCRRVFQLAQGVDFRLSNTGGQGKCEARLELALLYFFQTFRRMYMWENHGMSPSVALTGIVMVGGIAKPEYTANPKQKVFQRFFEHMGLGDHATIINIIVTKVGNNLKYWPDEEDVVGRTLQLFLDMASGYSSSKMLLGLDTVKYLVQNHTPEFFPFLSVPANTRHRTTFHMTLARLIFSSTEDTNAMFEAFMEPLLLVLGQLGSAAAFRQESVKRALIGVCRDLRGVVAATNNRRTYGALFEALYPVHFPVFVRAAEEWGDTPDVVTALLKFVQELVYNKAQRLVFDQSSPNGILLFRETSKVVCACGQRVLQKGVVGDVYRDKYKAMSLCLSVLSTALSGTYVNFGVFTLYNDKALDNALETALQLALSVPLADIMAFPKLCKGYFSFFEILFRNHIQVVLALDTVVFMQVMQAQHEGLQMEQSLDAPLAAQCAATIDHLATYLFTYGSRELPAVHSLKRHLAANPTLLSGLLATLFNILLFDCHSNQTANQWAVTRPILSLLLADEQAFNAYKEHLLATQSPENAAKLTDALTKLLQDIQRNLESTNRDRFTQRLTSFRVAVRNFLTM